MAFTFDSTVASSASNSYLSVDEANDYFAGRFGAEKWTEFTTPQKQSLLVTATKKLDTATFGGLRSKIIQSLQWPRRGLTDRDGYSISDLVIPNALKEAACEMAYWIWTEEDRLLSDTDIEQVDTYKVGPMDFQVNKNRVTFPSRVDELLKSIGPGVLVSKSGDTGQQVRFSR